MWLRLLCLTSLNFIFESCLLGIMKKKKKKKNGFLIKKTRSVLVKKLILRIYDRFFEFSPYLEWFLNKISGKFGSCWLYWKHELLTNKVFLGNRPHKCVLELTVIGKYLVFRLWKSSEHTPHFNMEYDVAYFQNV